MKPRVKTGGLGTQGFPRWKINLHSTAADATATTSTATSDDCAHADTLCKRRAILDTVQQVSDTNTPCSSSHVTVSSSDYVVAYHMPFGEDCAPTCGAPACRDCSRRPAARHNAAGEASVKPEEYVGTEFQKNWPALAESSTASDSPVSDSSPLPVLHELVVKFAGRSAAGGSESKAGAGKQLQPRTGGNSRGGDADPADRNFPTWRGPSQPATPLHRRRGAWLSNASNVTAATTDAFGAEAAIGAKKGVQPLPPPSPQQPEHQPQHQHPADGEQASCFLVEFTPLRILKLVLYYLLLWAVTAGITMALLELSMVLTSRGKFPYYMSGHSFFLLSPRVAFAGANPEPGKLTEFANLTLLRDKLAAEIRRAGDTSGSGGGLRPCDLAADATTEESALMRPCNLTRFVAMASDRVTTLLKDRPAALVQIRRHLGYMPARGPGLAVTCTCTVDGGKSLALRYLSWNGADLVESDGGGLVMQSFFPLLTRWHSAPAVIVAVNASVADADWVDRQLTLRCKAADGGTEEQPERELLLRVKAMG